MVGSWLGYPKLDHMCTSSSANSCSGHDAGDTNFVLAAGVITDLPELERWCATLPNDAWGTIFIEAFTPHQKRAVQTPAGVSVVWLCREQGNFLTSTSTFPAKGALLTRAVNAWLDEWVRADPFAGDHYYIWAGGRGTPAMNVFWAGLETELTQLWSNEALPRT